MKRIDSFLCSIGCCIVLPLLPLLLDVHFHRVVNKDYLLAAAMYPISLFINSKSQFLFSIGALLSIIYCIGLTTPNDDFILSSAKYTLVLVSIVHVIERVNLHLIKDEKFLNFNR